MRHFHLLDLVRTWSTYGEVYQEFCQKLNQEVCQGFCHKMNQEVYQELYQEDMGSDMERVLWLCFETLPS